MTMLPLNDYLEKIAALLEDNQFDSVIGHCYHILKQYPRHVETYRLLAKGFLGAHRVEEATEIFQRILSTDPNDLIAHIALSDIAQNDGNGDAALYHLERAFELDPYNGAIQDELNRFYESSADLGSTRIPLNNGALARLYVKGEMYDRAIRVLEEQVAEDNGRVDLDVLLAEAHWREGNRVEAAGVSLKILDSLPNSIVANAVLTDIWFNSGRTSDAKRHAKNLQSMMLLDRRHYDPESVAGVALSVDGAPKLPELIQIDTLEEIDAAEVAVTMHDMSLPQDSKPSVTDSDVGDMYDWLSGVVKPSAENRMEEVLEPDSWPMSDETVAESDWFVDQSNTVEQDEVADDVVDLLNIGDLAEDVAEEESDDLFAEPASDDLADQFVLEFNEQAKTNANLPEWLDADDKGESASADDPFGQADEALPDWLSAATGDDLEPLIMDAATASQWLEEDAVDDSYEELPDNVKDTQDWLADLNQDFDDITEEEPAEWLSEPAKQEGEADGGADWFADFMEDSADETAVSPTSEADDAAWSDDSWLLDPPQTPSTPEEEMAPMMNDKEQDSDKKKPQNAEGDNQEQSDMNDWLSDLTEAESDGDDDFSWFDELEVDGEDDSTTEAGEDAFDGQEFDDFFANLDDEPAASEAVGESDSSDAEFGDIDQWLNDLSKDDEEGDDDWISNLVEEEPQDSKVFTDWLNSEVVESDSAPELVVDEPAQDGLTDLLAESDDADELGGLTDLLEEAGGAEEAVELEAGQSLTDLLGETVVEQSEAMDELDDLFGDVNEDDGLTDLLAEETAVNDDLGGLTALLAGEDDGEEADGLTDLLGEETAVDDDLSSLTALLAGEDDSEEVEGLTDLLGEDEDDQTSSLTALLEGDDESDFGLTGLLAESDSEPAFDEEPAPVTDWADEDETSFEDDLTALLGGDDDEAGLTDLLDDSDDSADGLTDLLGEEEAGAGLTALLAGDDSDDDDLLDLFGAEADDEEVTDLFAETDDGGLTDLLQTEAEDALDQDLFDDASDEIGLTDLLDDEQPVAETDGWADESAVEDTDIFDLMGEKGMTDLLGEPSEPEDVGGLTDLLDEVEGEFTSDEPADDGSLTDLLDEITVDSISDSNDDDAELDDFWGDTTASDGLTGLLNEMESTTEPDEEWTDLLGEAPAEESLTDLLGEAESDDDGFGLTDLLADDETPDNLGGLTDLLADDEESVLDEAEPEPFELPDQDNWVDQLPDDSVSEKEEESLTDLLDEIDGDLLIDEEDELGYLAMAQSDDTSLTDLLGESADEDAEDDDLPDIGGLHEMLEIDSEDDALASIDTNLPEWMSSTESSESDSDISGLDWLKEDEESEDALPKTTGLLSKLDEIPDIKAAIEESNQQQAEAEAAAAAAAAAEEAANTPVPFEPTMSEYLTSDDDAAWLEQLGGGDEAETETDTGLDWMEEDVSEPKLDWLDTAVLTEDDGDLDDELLEDEAEPIAEADGIPSDLDDAMSWLDEMVIEEDTPIEPLPTIAEVLDEDIAVEPEKMVIAEETTDLEDDFSLDDLLVDDDESDFDETVLDDELEVVEQAETAVSLSTVQEDDSELATDIDDELADALSEIDDEIAWLDALDDEADSLEMAIVDDAPTVESESALDDLDLSNEDEMEDAMAWLEQLAANQGAPLDELPTVSEKTTVITPPPDLTEEAETVESEMEPADEPPLDATLVEALDWLETVALADVDKQSANGSTADLTITTDGELADALDWLESVAKQSDAPAAADETVAPEVEELDTAADVEARLDDLVEQIEEETAVSHDPEPIVAEQDEQPTQADGEPAEEIDLFASIFDIPDDQDAAMAWLEDGDGDDAAAMLEEMETAVDEPEAAQSDEADLNAVADELEDSAPEIEETVAAEEVVDFDAPIEPVEEQDSLFDSIFDIPDDQDAAMAWLEDDSGEIDLSAFGELEADAPEADETVAQSSDDDAPAATDEVDELESELFENVPEDPDAAMAWLERLAAKQGAPLAELPSVDEPVEDVETPEWIAAQMEESDETAAEEASFEDDRPVLPPLEDAPAEEPDAQDVATPIHTDELDEAIAADELPEGLPDWFSLDEAEGMEDEIPSQTDWLDSIPELGGTDWLTSESDAASINSESVDILPDTGPLIEAASIGTGPLPDLDPLEEEAEDVVDEDVDDISSIIEEPDSAVYRVDRNRLEEAKTAVEQQNFDSAIETLQSLVAEGNGLMLLIGELEFIAENNPDQPAFRRLLGDAYMRNGQLQKALLTYREALDQL